MAKMEQGPFRLWDLRYLLHPFIKDDSLVSVGARDSVDPFEEHASQKFPYGTKLEYGDRVFRYTGNGAVALVVAVVTVSEIIEANGDRTDMAVDTPAIGATEMEVTNGANTAISASEFKEGYVHVNDGTGEGYAHRIRDNDAMATSTAGTVFIYRPVVVAFVAATTVSITRNPYDNVVIAPASANTAKPVGVTNIAVTADRFFWAQTRGPCTVLTDSTTAAIVQGQPVRSSEDDAGGVALRNLDEAAINDAQIGIAIHVNADGEHSLIYLTID